MTSGTRRRLLETAREFFFQTSSHTVIILFGGLGLSVWVRVNFVAMVKVSKLLGSNFNPNPTSNFALTLI